MATAARDDRRPVMQGIGAGGGAGIACYCENGGDALAKLRPILDQIEFGMGKLRRELGR